MTPREVANVIFGFTPAEVAELRRLLDEGWGGSGVREPIPVIPPDREGEVSLPEDYWESAE